MTNRSNDIGGMGASARPGDVRRALRIVRSGLDQLVEDAMACKDTLHEAYWSLTNDERVDAEGSIIGDALEQVLGLVNILGGARLLCPDLTPKGMRGD